MCKKTGDATLSSYRYDDNGNITHEYNIDSNNVETLRYRYTYDEANQITRVDDNIQSKTYVYQYDKGGNRVSEKIYAYTLSDSLGTVQQEIVSEYDNIVWDDLLTSYNGKEITYDNAGNPTSYGGKTFVWNGKQLKQITAADGSKTLFNYDANGLRTRKVQYDETNRLSYYVEYIWADGKIVSQYLTLIAYVTYSDGSTKSVPIGPIPSKIIYDDNGIPQGFTCGEATFGFVRNLQGDVIAMVDFEGNIVMEYSYDPWGNIEYHLADGVTEEEAIIYTALCPLTYRGYNYDFTTGLYYIQSRYYNPEWGRFLNCDDTAILLATQGETHNANLFAYCANNPVNRLDYNGRESVPLSVLIPTVITAFYGVYTAPMSAHIMTMEKVAINYGFEGKYNIVNVVSSWYTHKWYYYEYFDIITYGGQVHGWKTLLEKVSYYISIYKELQTLQNLSDAAQLHYLMSIGKTIVFSKADAISFAVGASVDLIICLICGAMNKISDAISGMDSDDWYFFNWKVEQRYWYLFGQETKLTLHLYTPLAAMF